MNSLQVHLGTYSHVLMLAETEENQNLLLIGRFYTTDELSMYVVIFHHRGLT